MNSTFLSSLRKPRRAGYQTATAFDGAEALAQIEHLRHISLPWTFCSRCVAGGKFLGSIRKHPRQQIATLPVIVLSALRSPQLQADLRHSGVEHCLGKPFSVTELCLIVRSTLNKPHDTNWANPL
jgi:CheY-like chemotaxis protein